MLSKCSKAILPQLLSSPTETYLAETHIPENFRPYETASAVKNLFIAGKTGFFEKVVCGTIDLLIRASEEKNFLECEYGGVKLIVRTYWRRFSVFQAELLRKDLACKLQTGHESQTRYQ